MRSLQYFREDASQAKKSYEDKFGAKGAKGAKAAGSKKETPGEEVYLDDAALSDDRIMADAGADAKDSGSGSRPAAKVILVHLYAPMHVLFF